MNRLKSTLIFFIVIAIIAAFTSCTFITKTTGESAEPIVGESGSGFYERVALTDKINVNTTELTVFDSLADVLDEIRPSVVEIYATLSGGTSAGSGVIVDVVSSEENDVAYVITCHHVIAGSTNTRIKTIYGDVFNATLVGSDPKSDIGLIAVKADSGKFSALKSATFANSDDLRYGMEVVAIGNPLGILGGTVTKGIISSIGREVEVEGKTMTLLQTDASINSGNSGGGLFDTKTGALVGIVNAGYAAYAADGLNFAIPANVAMAKETALFSTYDAGKTFGYIAGNYDFGIGFSIVSIEPSSWSFWNSKYYVHVSSIDTSGAFYKGGVREGDVIYGITIGDKSFDISKVSSSTINLLDEFLAGDYKVGDEVTVTYGRGSSYDTKRTLTFKISQYVYGN